MKDYKVAENTASNGFNPNGMAVMKGKCMCWNTIHTIGLHSSWDASKKENKQFNILLKHSIWGKRGETTTISPPTSDNTNPNTNFSSLTGTSPVTVDASMIVSKNQSVFDDFSKLVQDPDLAASFEKMTKIWDLD